MRISIAASAIWLLIVGLALLLSDSCDTPEYRRGLFVMVVFLFISGIGLGAHLERFCGSKPESSNGKANG
jgi:hypothetical protein